MNKHGGKRKGSGRKPAEDKKQTVVLYIESSIITDLGGIENAKQKLYNFAKIEAGGKIIKTEQVVETLIKCSDKCNMHFVSNNAVAWFCDACGAPKEQDRLYCKCRRGNNWIEKAKL